MPPSRRRSGGSDSALTKAVHRLVWALSFGTTRTEPYKARLEDGRDALARGAWAEARKCFGEALALNETPEAYEGLGTAARYQLDSDAAPRWGEDRGCPAG